MGSEMCIRDRLNWFRSGQDSCPLCRDTSCTHRLNYISVRERSKLLRRRSRRKDAHPELKRLVVRLKKAEEKAKQCRKEASDYERRHRDVKKMWVKLRAKAWNAARREQNLRMELGVYSDETTPMPLVQSEGGHDTSGRWWGFHGPTDYPI